MAKTKTPAPSKTEPSGWIVTSTGGVFYPLAPHPYHIDLEDVAHALSNICRFTGHCREFYSVAQHSVYVARLAQHAAGEDAAGLLGLFHDAPEAYLCDIARPLKRQPAFAAYRVAESRLFAAVVEAFELNTRYLDAVLEIDERIVTNEAYALLPRIPEGWALRLGYTRAELQEQLGVTQIDPWPPAKAKGEFLQAYHRLKETGA